MTVHKLSVSLPPHIVAALSERGDNTSGAIAVCLDRYFVALDRARSSLRSKLGQSEVALILDALNGIQVNPSYIIAEVSDAISINRLDEKHGVDGRALRRELTKMSYIELAALGDAAERFWRRVAAGEDAPVDGALD